MRLVVVALVVMLAAASVPQVVGAAWAATKRDRLAELLVKRDPGKRVGGDTLVGSTAGAVLRGGARPDQLHDGACLARGADCRHKP
jgi:hypothetical protein